VTRARRPADPAIEGISAMPDVKPLPRWFRTANRAVGVLSRFGFTMGPVCVLMVSGRRTGKPRTTPVSPPGTAISSGDAAASP
jgi:hypothetical protein